MIVSNTFRIQKYIYMQTIKGITLICIVLFLCLNCNSKSEKKAGSSENSDILEIGDTDINNLSKASSAICLWPKVGLRDKPGRKDTKYLTTIYFGENVTFLDEHKKPKMTKNT